jgi:CheY-like chemotaxis protein
MRVTILVVNDAEPVLELLGQALRAAGWSVDLERDARNAPERARALRPDLILLDVEAPTAEASLQAIQALREDPATTGVPVMLSWSCGIAVGYELAEEWGADDYLDLPWNETSSLVRQIGRLVPSVGGNEGHL